MEAPDLKSLPDAALRPVVDEKRRRPPGRPCPRTPTCRSPRARPTQPLVPAGRASLEEATRPLRRLGLFLCVDLHRRLGLLGAESRAGDGSGDPDLDPGDRPRAHLPRRSTRARERHHHRHRRPRRLDRGGRDLHAAGALHPEARSASGADHLHLPGGRLPRRAVPDPAAPLLRARHARPASLPRGHRDHRSPGHRREGRVAGQAAARRRPRSRASTTSSSPPSTSGRSTSTSSSSRRCGRSPTRRAWRSSFDAIGFILGLGYVMGLRSSMILCAGGVLSNLVLVPLIWMIGSHLPDLAGLSRRRSRSRR